MPAKTQAPMSRSSRSKFDFDGSLYREPCPECGAAPLCWCVRPGGKRADKPHPERRGAKAPAVAHRGFHHEPRSGAA
ncbi:MAG: zinc finger domain-containing protein [Burkholderiales bacterium]